jgi:hypothetical protein
MESQAEYFKSLDFKSRLFFILNSALILDEASHEELMAEIGPLCGPKFRKYYKEAVHKAANFKLDE